MRLIFRPALFLAAFAVLASASAALADPPQSGKDLYEQGMTLWNGKGVPKDVVKARALLQQSASLRYLDAFSGLAMLEYGEAGNDAAKQQMFLWLGRGTFQGDPRSQAVLALFMMQKGGPVSPMSVALYQVAADTDAKFVPFRDEYAAKLSDVGKLETAAMASQIRAQVALNRKAPTPLRLVADGIVSRGPDGLPQVVESYGTYATFSGGRGESCDHPARLETVVPAAMVRAGLQHNWMSAVYPGSQELHHSTGGSPDASTTQSIYRIKTREGEERDVCIDITKSQVLFRSDFLLDSLQLTALGRCSTLSQDQRPVCVSQSVKAITACADAVKIPEQIADGKNVLAPLNGRMTQCLSSRVELVKYPVKAAAK